MKVVVTYESRTGTTARAADLIGAGLRHAGAEVSVAPVDALDFGELGRADLVVVGTWCDGLFFFGQRPGGAGKIAAELPDLWDKATFSFVTYAHNPGTSADKLGGILEAKGAVNLGSSSLHRGQLAEDAADFVDEIIAEFASA